MTVTRPRILVVDDDPKVLSLMQRGLAFEGYDVDVAPDGDEGLSVAHVRPPHLVVLDVMMPGVDGLEVCRRLRAVDRDLAILMLTGRASVPARIEGLDAGADDYLVKPFAFDELLARIRALLRRTLPDDHETLELDDLRLVPATRDVTRAGVPVELTAREFDLLTLLLRHPNQVLGRAQIMDRIWGPDFFGDSNVLEVFVANLRRELEANGEPRLIQTVRGVGYVLRRTG